MAGKRANARGLRLIATGLAASMLLVGCAGNGENADPVSNVELTEDTIPEFAWSIQQMPASIDLARAANVNVQHLLAIVTEPLERYTPAGEFESVLASEVSQPDDMTIVYTIPDDVKFSDGTPLTADDVVWSLKHVTDAAGGAQTAARVTSIADISATGDHEVTVKLSRTDPTARAALAGISYVQQATFAAQAGEALGSAQALPIGTGPYRLTALSPSEATYERNPEYTRTAPKPDAIRIVPITDDNGAQLAMRSGEIQAATVTNVKQLDPWTGIEGTQVLQLPANVTSWLVFDTTKAPFDDVNVRKAFAHAVDREGVSAVTYGPSGVILESILPASLLAGVAPSEDEANEFLASLPQYDFDLEKTEELLSKATADVEGLDVSIPYTTSSPWAEPTMLNLQQNLKDFGITVTPAPAQPEQWAAQIFAHELPDGMQSMQLIATIPDPNAVLPRITGDANIAAPGFNLANWSDPDVEAALKVLTGSTDRDARWEATKTVLTRIAEDVPYAPLFSPNFVTALADGYGYSEPLANSDLMDGNWVYKLRAAK